MNQNRIMLLSQLVNSLGENYHKFELAYNDSNKEEFDSSSAIIIELQKKIAYLLKNS
jgi:hypothetical protein